MSVRQQGLTHDSSKQDAADVEDEQHEAPGTATQDTFFGDATEEPVKGEARVITESLKYLVENVNYGFLCISDLTSVLDEVKRLTDEVLSDSSDDVTP